MITSIIFFGHLFFSLIIFTKKMQDENLSSAFQNVALIAILFSVGWVVSGIISKLLMEPEGFGIYLDRDAFSLIILSIAEYFFYRMYYRGLFTEVDMERQ
ncbi:MAG: hypothetical protein C0442_00405 [Chlorobiaceae bacterium]|nr:hypothetical protein [Chlorobiaceae bacterium]